MSAYLEILVRVPVTIKNDDCVGSLQVETKAASTSAENEELIGRIRRIKELQELRAIGGFGAACVWL